MGSNREIIRAMWLRFYRGRRPRGRRARYDVETGDVKLEDVETQSSAPVPPVYPDLSQAASTGNSAESMQRVRLLPAFQ